MFQVLDDYDIQVRTRYPMLIFNTSKCALFFGLLDAQHLCACIVTAITKNGPLNRTNYCMG